MPRIADSFIAELEQEAATTRRVLERVPADKYDWKPHEKSFSLGALASHVARVPGGIASILGELSFDYGSMTGEDPVEHAGLLTALDESVAAAKDALNGWGEAGLMETWKLVKDGEELMAAPRIGIVRSIMLNHWYHHRGQLTVYLRMLNVPVPSVYGPSADENPFG